MPAKSLPLSPVPFDPLREVFPCRADVYVKTLFKFYRPEPSDLYGLLTGEPQYYEVAPAVHGLFFYRIPGDVEHPYLGPYVEVLRYPYGNGGYRQAVFDG